MATWTKKDQRQYEHIKSSALERGKSEDTASEIAGRTVNKSRRKQGRTPNTKTQGTGNPNTPLDLRTVDELRNMAAKRNIVGRSRMRKQELVKALGRTR